MKRWPQILAVTGLALLFAGFAAADTLELKDGRVLQGKYLGGTQAVMRFEVDGQVQTFSTNNIVALTFTGRGSAAPAPQSAAPETDVAPSAPAPNTPPSARSEEHTSELQSHVNLVCRLLLEKKNR